MTDDTGEYKPPKRLLPIGICECVRGTHLSFDYRYRRLCTKFVENKLNYMLSCKAAFEERNDYYLERWAEYYADCF